MVLKWFLEPEKVVACVAEVSLAEIIQTEKENTREICRRASQDNGACGPL